MNNQDFRVQALREGGAVKRYHAGYGCRAYDVAQHSFNALSLLLVLYPKDPSINLVKSMLWHDCAERWLGDLPAPAKWDNPKLDSLYKQAEEKILNKIEANPLLSALEVFWVKGIDTLELWYWCREEVSVGNTSVDGMRILCEETLDNMKVCGTLPTPIYNFFNRVRSLPYNRLNESFSRALKENGLGEA